MTLAAVNIADQLNVNYICTFTQSGDSARRLCRLRPSKPVLAFTPDDKVRAFMALFWGVDAVQQSECYDTDSMTEAVDRYLLKYDLVKPDELLVMTAGTPLGVAGSTNMVKVHRVGDLDDSGARAPESREKLGPYKH